VLLSGRTVAGVLFDLDGTLADTAPDLAHVVNLQRQARGLTTLPLEHLRPLVSQGARGMLRAGFDLTPEHADYPALREEFLALYADNLCRDTRLFDGMAQVLDGLDAAGFIWGVVTNKHARFSEPLLEAMGLAARAACIVSGDTCVRAKPFPDPLLEASRRLDLPPALCIYVGDDERDVQAGRAAAMLPIAALYGYLGDGPPPAVWGAAHHIQHPLELLNLLGLPSPMR